MSLLYIIRQEENSYKCIFQKIENNRLSFVDVYSGKTIVLDKEELMESLKHKVDLIELSLDGDSWCALLGEDLQVGVAGFGKTKAEALHKLAEEME